MESGREKSEDEQFKEIDAAATGADELLSMSNGVVKAAGALRNLGFEYEVDGELPRTAAVYFR